MFIFRSVSPLFYQQCNAIQGHQKVKTDWTPHEDRIVNGHYDESKLSSINGQFAGIQYLILKAYDKGKVYMNTKSEK